MKALLIGHGKMGQMIEKLAPENEVTISNIIERSDLLTPALLSGIDVIIDFSGPDGILSRIETALIAHVPMCIGTTDWQELKEAAKKLVQKHDGALIVSSNFSLGFALFSQLVKTAAALFSKLEDYDVSISERHHREKKDHPSGTAKELAQTILASMPKKKKVISDLQPGAIEKESLHIASDRVGYFAGEHQVIFDGPDDTITLSHNARNRHNLAKGALIAAKWIIGKKGYFTVEDLL